MSAIQDIVPNNVADLSDSKKKSVVKDLIKLGKSVVDNEEIAKLVPGMTVRSIAAIRSHAEGKIPDPPRRTRPQEDTLVPEGVEGVTAGALAMERAEEGEEEEPYSNPETAPNLSRYQGEEGPVRLVDVDHPNPAESTPPGPEEAAKVHEDSRIADMEAEIRRLTKMVSKFNGNGHATVLVQPAPAEPPNKELYTEFESYREGIYVDNMRRAKFEMWKADVNAEAIAANRPPYKGSIGDFMLEAFDEWFDKRGYNVVLRKETPMSAPISTRRIG
jgi:hypothetical protein